MEKTIFAADKVVSPSQIIEKEVFNGLFTHFYRTHSHITLLFVQTRNLLSHYSLLRFDNVLIH